MASTAQHVDQAERNERLYRLLQQDQAGWTDWQITALFYSAVHYVDAYLVSIGEPEPRSHEARALAIARIQLLRQSVAIHFTALKDFSRDARYNLARLPP